MALYDLDEGENAPGAVRREMALLLKKLAKGQHILAQHDEAEAQRLCRNAEIYDARYQAAARLPHDMLAQPAGHWARLERDSLASAKNFKEAARQLTKEARQNQRRAFGNALVANIQTLAAKLGL